jgi:hypothetical protein
MAAIVRASHPISFQLLNRDRQPILGIFDGQQGQTLKLDITNSSRRNIKPKQLTGSPSADNHHFEVRFRPGTLILPDSVTPNRPAIAVEETGWKISDKPVVTDGAVSFYLITNPTEIESAKSTSVTLKNLSGDGKVGAHGTRVELKWNSSLEYAASAGQSPEPLAPGHRLQHLSVINQSGQQHIPLYIGIVGNDKVLNNKTESALKLRITNMVKPDPLKPGDGTIKLNPGPDPKDPPATKFIFSFDASTGTEKDPWALGSIDQVNKIVLNAGTKFNTPSPTVQGQSVQWTMWPTDVISLKPGDSIDLNISKIVTEHPSGLTNLYIHYKNIPGYWDGDFVAHIEKAPLMYASNGVGIGTNEPQAALDVKGNVRAQRLLVSTTGKEGVATPVPSDALCVVGDTLLNTIPTQIKCIGDDHRIIFGEDGFEIRERKGIRFSPGCVNSERKVTNVMTADGNVGIGTGTPEKHLHVSGTKDQEVMIDSTDGVKWSLQSSGSSKRFEIINRTAQQSCLSILNDGNVGIGTTDPKAKLHVSGDVQVEKNKEIYFTDNGQIRSHDDTHRIMFRRETYNVMELREAGHIVFSPGSADGKETAKMVLKNTGDVGIGTSDPKYTLHVNGGLRAENGISVGGEYDVNVDAHGVVGGRLKIMSDGHVGIGTNSPSKGKLVVSGSSSGSIGKFTYMNGSRFVSGGDSTPNDYSIWATNCIAAREVHAFSDERIKNIQGRSDSATDLRTLLGIEITDYRHRDVIGNGTGAHKKVIGQQIEKVFPQAVTTVTDVVPDIYQQASIRDGWVALATELKKGDRVKLIRETDEELYEVLEATDDKFRVDFKHEDDRVFVYGREVDDFLTVDYDAISMLNVSATQQIKKEMDQELNALRVENAELRAANDALAKRLQLLESKLETVLGVMAAAAGSNGNGRH